MTLEYSEVLVRYGEIGIKSKQTRKRMEDLLIKHIKSALREAGIEFSKVRREYGRIFIVSEMTQEASKIASYLSERGFEIALHQDPAQLEKNFLTLKDGTLFGRVTGSLRIVRAVTVKNG